MSYSNILEAILVHVHPDTGARRFKSTKKNFEVRVIDGEPKEVMVNKGRGRIPRTPEERRQSQRLYKSPATLRNAVLRGRTTKMLHHALGLTKKDTSTDINATPEYGPNYKPPLHIRKLYDKYKLSTAKSDIDSQDSEKARISDQQKQFRHRYD